jgi:hypothetical protein
MKEIDMGAFAVDAKEGMSINKLAKKYGLQWAEAKQCKAGIEGESSPGAEDEAPENYDLSTTVPARHIMDLIRGTSSEDLVTAIEALDVSMQAAILQSLLQRKIDALLEPKGASVTSLELVSAAS